MAKRKAQPFRNQEPRQSAEARTLPLDLPELDAVGSALVSTRVEVNRATCAASPGQPGAPLMPSGDSGDVGRSSLRLLAESGTPPGETARSRTRAPHAPQLGLPWVRPARHEWWLTTTIRPGLVIATCALCGLRRQLFERGAGCEVRYILADGASVTSCPSCVALDGAGAELSAELSHARAQRWHLTRKGGDR